MREIEQSEFSLSQPPQQFQLQRDALPVVRGPAQLGTARHAALRFEAICIPGVEIGLEQQGRQQDPGGCFGPERIEVALQRIVGVLVLRRSPGKSHTRGGAPIPCGNVETLPVSASGYRAWKRGGSLGRKRLSAAQLLALIKAIHKELKGVYGSPRIVRSCSRGDSQPASHG